MALKSVLTGDEFNTLHDVLKAEYVPGDNGTYVLEADIDAHPKVGGLKSALEKERKSTKAAADETRKLKEQMGDLDPVKAREAQVKLQELLDKQLHDDGKGEEVYKARVEALNKAHAAELKARDLRLEESTKSYSALDNDFTALVLDGSIRDEALRAGVRKEYLPDVTFRLKDYGIDGVKWRLGDGRKVVAMAGDDIKYGKDGVTAMPIGEGLEALRKSNPLYFEQSTGGGAHNSMRQEGNRFVMSNADAKDYPKWKAANAAAQKAGHDLNILEP